jgi:hypothetical protein
LTARLGYLQESYKNFDDPGKISLPAELLAIGGQFMWGWDAMPV